MAVCPVELTSSVLFMASREARLAAGKRTRSVRAWPLTTTGVVAGSPSMNGGRVKFHLFGGESGPRRGLGIHLKDQCRTAGGVIDTVQDIHHRFLPPHLDFADGVGHPRRPLVQQVAIRMRTS